MFNLFQSAPAGFDLPLVASLTAFIALPVKFMVDVVRGAVPQLPTGLVPLAGIVIGYVFGAIVLVAVGTPFAASVYAQIGIASVGAQVAAAAASSFQTKVNKVDERMDAALSLPKGSTKADVDAAVKKENSK